MRRIMMSLALVSGLSGLVYSPTVAKADYPHHGHGHHGNHGHHGHHGGGYQCGNGHVRSWSPPGYIYQQSYQAYRPSYGYGQGYGYAPNYGYQPYGYGGGSGGSITIRW